MCSRIFGPASVPSLLMCPISITGIPLVLEKRRSADAHSRTWVTLPGLVSASSVDMVWLESIITISGFTSLMCAKMFSSDVSHSILMFALSGCAMRSARIFSWWALSSPLTYRMLRSGSRSIVCRVSVLLPIPGSPPSSTIEPGTSPPPSTLFSSSSRVSILGSSFELISLRNSGRFLLPPTVPRTDTAADRAAIEPVSADIFISLNVFQRPQLGHLPIHLADSCPQWSHTYAVLSFAIMSQKY